MIKISLKFVAKGLINIIAAFFFKERLYADQATSNCLNQRWLVYRRIYMSLGVNEVRNRLK